MRIQCTMFVLWLHSYHHEGHYFPSLTAHYVTVWHKGGDGSEAKIYTKSRGISTQCFLSGIASCQTVDDKRGA